MSGAVSASTLATVALGTAAAGGMSSAVGAYNQSKASKAAYEYQAGVSRNNAMIAEWQAQDALQRGARSVQQQQLKTAQLKGSQRARLAASGVALDEGSALHILDDTDYMGQVDVNTIENNTAREAWGFRNQAAGYTSDSSMLSARSAAENPGGAAFGSLLGSAGQVASQWYAYSNTISAPKKGP